MLVVMTTHMTEQEVVYLLERVANAGVIAWIDGGWGVDALLEKRTREHGDLDLVIEKDDEQKIVDMLSGEGFREVQMWFTTPVHTVWHHSDGRAVDLHLIVLNSEGDGVYGDEGVYPSGALAGQGSIGGWVVRCISPAAQVEFHRGYELREQDRHDVVMLCQRFGLVLPPEYQN